VSIARGILKEKIEFTKGVGENRAKVLKSELGVETIEDLLQIYPFRYDDRSTYQLINNVKDGDTVQLQGQLISISKKKMKRGSRLVGSFKDPSGFIELNWFQGAQWLVDKLKPDQNYILNGKVKVYRGVKSISHPELEVEGTSSGSDPFLPVYASTEKLNQKGLGIRARRKIIKNILDRLQAADLPESLPAHYVEKLNICSRFDSVRWIHLPPSREALGQASNRLKFEELFFLQLMILHNKVQRDKKLKGLTFDVVGTAFNKFYTDKLSFELTGAQKRVVKEIRHDLGRGVQMNRLLQGDVGSGKTIVALMTMLIAIDNGYQACLLAPTQILAHQHYQSISEMVKGLGVQVAFLTGSVKGRVRKELLSFLKEGHIDILVGTHAILEEQVEFSNLGLAVTDEQHRFGVVQRSRLWVKNDQIPPHILVMTATPIPRTLAMTTYGDLDVSVIDELPPGRKEIKTIHRHDAHRSFVVKFMKEEIAKGRQIYVVYPLIDESEKLDLQNLQSGYEELLNYFPRPDYQITVVHGRMKPQDKDQEMQRFVSKTAQIMVATTVIEVGVNVPNASVMIIENAERFGLSQLHQLRGRVGRGADQSYCILMTKTGLSKYAKARIDTMCRTNDGFVIAEEDMKLRGPGDITGTQQSGIVELNIASLTEDRTIMETARHLALILLQQDPDMEQPQHQATKNHLSRLKNKNLNWGRIS